MRIQVIFSFRKYALPMHFGGPSRSMLATNILSGSPICAVKLSHLWQTGKFQYPFWAEKSDMEAFLRSTDSNIKGAMLLPNALPTVAEVRFYGIGEFYNIEQFSDPQSLFDHFLYKRHLHSFGRPFRFHHHDALTAHMRKHNLSSRHWVEQRFIETMFPGEITIDKTACGIFLPGFSFPFYNIAQTSDPSLLGYRLYNIPWSLTRGIRLPQLVHRDLCAFQRQKGLSFPLWQGFSVFFQFPTAPCRKNSIFLQPHLL